MSSMARPQSVSDQGILNAAWRVIAKRGHDSFTLAEVAEEVGLSRAAIILRFKSTKALKLELVVHMTDRFRQKIEAMPASRSGDALLDFADMIGQSIKSHDNFAHFMTVYRGNIQDNELAALERKRGQIMQDAISVRMPKTALDQHCAVLSFMAHLSGSMMQWEGESGISPSDYLIERTQDWLTLAQIQFTRRISNATQGRLKIRQAGRKR